MFEQPLYEFQPAAAPKQESDLFRNYEIRNWVLSPRLYKILGISALANILAILIVAQTSLLTMKGCDSPLVGSVCQVLDTVYVGSLLFGTEREYVDVAYDKTDLTDSDITFIDVSHVTPPLKYPAGYFQIANPEPTFEVVDGSFGGPEGTFMPGTIPGFPGVTPGIPMTRPSTGNDLFGTQQHIPPANPDVVDGSLPSSPSSHESHVAVNPGFQRRKYNRGGRVTAPPPVNSDGSIPGIPGSGTVAAVKPSPSPSPTPVAVQPTGPVDANDINTKPFKDLAMEVNTLLDNKQVDLQAPVQILATARLGKDGKIAKGSFKVASAAGSDKQLALVVTHAVAAFNDSNLLNYLKDLTGKDLSFMVQQDQDNIVAAIKTQVESDTRAQSSASALQLVMGLAVQKKENAIAALEAQNDPSKAEALQHLHDDLDLLKGTKVSSSGKELIINFSSPKALVHQMIQRKLAEQKAEPKPANGNASIKPIDNTAKK